MPAPRFAAALVAAVGLLVGLPASTARAEPQATAGLTMGVAGTGLKRELWDKTAFHVGLRGDILFGRSSDSSFGVGPYGEVLTHAFSDAQIGLGVSALAPVVDALPLVLSFGAYARRTDDKYRLEPGLAGSLFWGSRSYNYQSTYGMTGGLLTEVRIGLGESKETSIVVAAQLDLIVLSMPAIFLLHAIEGPSAEAAPVR